uniref:CARD domain-containing protein n=1 Tax=Myripristis murdjan TaxID=586833 RepID=A0A667Z7Q2_9TELE
GSQVRLNNDRDITDKASHVFDMVRNKGEKASLIMIDLLCKEDPFLSEHLGLI